MARPTIIDNPPEKVARFALHVIQHYAQTHNMTILAAWELLHEYGLIQNKLLDGYRPLHTQGMPYISNLMDVFLQERGYVTGHRSSRINDCFHTEETVKQL